MKPIAVRLRPGEDLKDALLKIANQHSLDAAALVSAVGSLTGASLRMAGGSSSRDFAGPLEVVSVTGTLSRAGMHIHIAVSDSEGRTFGGHLLPGCTVFTTVEVVVLDLSESMSFNREHDEATQSLELVIRSTTSA